MTAGERERNLAYGLLWLMDIDRRRLNDDLAARARALLFQQMSKDDQADGIMRARELMGPSPRGTAHRERDDVHR